MGNVIYLSEYKRRKNDMNERLKELIREIEKKNREGYKFSMKEVDEIALRILSILDYRSNNSATPIVKIIKQFGFKAYAETFEDPNLSGDIYINGDTFEKYGNDKVVIVNNMDEITHQRFVSAHELAHYLFDFLGNPNYEDSSVKFNAAYYKDKHDTMDEKRANRFAAAILMPKDIFIRQYNIAKSVDSSSLFVTMYLSRFFETSISSIERRIVEVMQRG